MYKPYFHHKKARYGLANTISTPFGEVEFHFYRLIKTIFIHLILAGALFICYKITDLVLFDYLCSAFIGLSLAYTTYRFLEMVHCRCFYCAKSRDEIENFIVEKSQKYPHFRDLIKDIQHEDDWYMLFKKDDEDIRKAVDQLSQTYYRQCPKNELKLFARKTNNLLLIVSLGWVFLSSFLMSIFHFPEMIKEFVLGLPILFYMLFFFHKSETAKRNKFRFLHEENIDEKKNIVKMKFDETNGGRFIFTVIKR